MKILVIYANETMKVMELDKICKVYRVIER